MSDKARALPVSVECDIFHVPADLRHVVAGRVEDLTRALAEVPAQSALWVSLRASGLRMDMGQWRFEFRITPERIHLVHAAPAART